MKVAIAGAAGRMGQTLVEAVTAEGDLELVVAHDVVHVGNLAGGLPVTSDNQALADADVVIDFTKPSATLAHLSHARACVIGTTGFDEKGKSQIAAASKRMPIVFSPNFAIGVNVVFKLAETAAQTLGEGYDVEIVEAHHRHKKDAPSGTAIRLGEAIAAAVDRPLAQLERHGRSGISPRQPGEIGLHSLRLGGVAGEHHVIFANEGEEIQLTHRTFSRETFARGALRAARFLAGRPPGLYSMADVLH
jgi:4-hydroxy-tetrahydrodipicolinate reductase